MNKIPSFITVKLLIVFLATLHSNAPLLYNAETFQETVIHFDAPTLGPVKPGRNVELVRENTPIECYGVTTFQQIYYHLRYTRRNISTPIPAKQCLRLYLLLLCGDISLNPGPIKYPCGGCHKPVAKNHRAVYCESCYFWVHIKCANIKPEHYVEMSKSDEPWLCSNCDRFHFSDSFFDDIGLLDISNSTTQSMDITCDIFDSLIELKKKHPNRFLCAYLNINSLRHKFYSLKEILTKNIIDLLFIAETKLDDTFPDAQFAVNNFHMWRADRTSNGGGLVAYLRSDIAGDRKTDFEFKKTESICIEILQKSFYTAVNVKWGKEKFTDVECDTDESPEVFKAQLFALSGVQPDRQKVMMKGTVLKEDGWGDMKLKDGAMLLMMGTADELPEEPVKKTVFMEDMTDQQLASALKVPAGLTNLGNTCYMNATIQCLRSVPELKESLRKYTGGLTTGGAIVPSDSITAGLRDLLMSMDKSGQAIPPIVFLQVLHMAYPQFAEKSEHGGFQQQDANECWTEIVRCLQQKLPGVTGSSTNQSVTAGASAATGFMDQYFGGEFDVVMKCEETEEEPESKSTEKFYQLSCFIEKEVKYMHTGLRSRLEEHITKNSTTLGRDAVYKKSNKIRRLPGYLTIQFVRFYFKEKESINAKILKDVKFPLSLDVFDLCSEELQKKLLPAREKFKEQEDKLAEEATKMKKTGEKKNEKKDESKNTIKHPYSFPDDVGSNNSGYYELQAVLTHKGRSSSSGHYVAWVRRKGDEWLMFDDDNVTAITSEDVLKLSGGGDWHCAYVLLYGPRIYTTEVEEMETTS